MNWSNVKSLAIPVGGTARDVKRVSIGGSVVWEKPSPLPYDAEIAFLQADGNSRINAPVALSSTNLAAGVTINMTLDVPTAGNNRGLLAQGTNTYSAPWCVCTTGTAGEIRIFSTGKFSSPFSGLSGPTDITVEVDSTTVYLNIGGTRNGGTYSTSNQYSDNLAILGYDGYIAGSIATWPAPSGTRLYAYKMYVGNNLVADLIPVRVGQTGYLYDRVTRRLFGNIGTGAFTLGPDVVPVEYIESHGTEYIDTEFKADNACKFEIDFENKKTDGNYNPWLFGSRNGSSSAVDKSCVFLGYTNGTSYAMMGSAMPTFNQGLVVSGRHTLTMSLSEGVGIDGVVVATYTPSEQAQIYTNTHPNALFSMWNGSSLSNYFIGRVYSFKALKNGVPQIDFRPVRVGTEGAMMDTLTRRVYRNAGTGAFTYGGDLPYPIGG